MSRRERKKQDTERRILDAALDAMDEKGFTGASMEGIAERADVGVGTLYNYFSSKDELLVALVVKSTGDIIAESRLILDYPPDNPLDGVTGLQVQYLRGYHKFDKGLLLETVSIAFGRMAGIGIQLMEQDMRLISLTTELLEKYRQRGVLRADLDCSTAAMAVYGNFFIQMMLYLTTKEMTIIGFEEQLKKGLDIMLRGMLPGGGDK